MNKDIVTVAQIGLKDRRTLYYVATGLADYPSSMSNAGLKRLKAAGLVDSHEEPTAAKLTEFGLKICTEAGWHLKGNGVQAPLFDGPARVPNVALAAAPEAAPAPDVEAPAVVHVATQAAPFLKWAGSKRALWDDIRAAMPEAFGRVFVPFIGGGTPVFAMPGRVAYISDANSHLINVYTCVRDRVEDVIGALPDHKNERDYFDALKQSFNEGYGDDVWRAAAFIYMNRVGFNGLCRYTKAGKFNVPFGDGKPKTICDADKLRACSVALRNVRVECEDFRAVESLAEPGDLVYCDPPYCEESKTASFTGYWGTWTDQDHADVAAMFKRLAARGVHVLASNSDTPMVRDLYAGFEMRVLTRANSINSKASARGGKKELLILGGTWTPRGAS